MSRIFIVGSGVVGSATGRGFLQMGHDVTFVDVLPNRVAELRAAGYDAREELNLVGEQPSYIFLTLPTPNVGPRYDLTAFQGGVVDVANALAAAEESHTVVVRSTVPPLTTANLVKPLLEAHSGKVEGRGFTLASNPEFLRAASADEDFRWPWMTVIGASNKRVQERLTGLLAPFGGELRVFDKPETAEMIKIVHNVFNATKISFWNEIWRVCQVVGIPQEEVATTVARSAEGSFNINYGIRGGSPYGGVCLPKDTNGMLGFAEELGIAMPLLASVVAVNDSMEHVAALVQGTDRVVDLREDVGAEEQAA